MGTEATASPGQPLRALEQANRVRLARAKLKRRIEAGHVSVADVILTCPWEAESMAVGDLLMSQRRWGSARMRRLLLPAKVAENKTLGSLTYRQRAVLAAVLTAKTGPVAHADPPRSADPPRRARAQSLRGPATPVPA
jgi:hypothetical protein